MGIAEEEGTEKNDIKYMAQGNEWFWLQGCCRLCAFVCVYVYVLHQRHPFQISPTGAKSMTINNILWLEILPRPRCVPKGIFTGIDNNYNA